MTTEQIETAVAAMRATPAQKAVLLREAKAGNPQALFALRAVAARQAKAAK